MFILLHIFCQKRFHINIRCEYVFRTQHGMFARLRKISGVLSLTSYGANSRSLGPAFWGPCLRLWRMACASCLAFALASCRGWPISRSGQWHARRRSGPPAHSCGPIRQTAGPRSRASSTRTPWPLACERSWSSAARGSAPPQTCSVPPPSLTVAMRSHRTARSGQEIQDRLLDVCAVRKPFCAR
jgi:hypothetical protein